MTGILKKIEALLIEEGIISDDKSDNLPKDKNIMDINFAVTRGHKMEFSDTVSFRPRYVSLLVPQNIDDRYRDTERNYWDYCRYLQDEWIVNPNMADRGNEQILPDGLRIQVLKRDNKTATANSQNANFNFSNISNNNTPDTTDIMAYLILGTTKGWKYEWENNQ